MSDTGTLEGAHAVAPRTALLREALGLGRLTRIMDVGANPANVPDYAGLCDAGLVEVHGFEPGEAAFARLMEAKRPNETYHSHAIGRSGPATFHVTANGSMASLYRPDPRQIEALGHWGPALTVREEVAVEVRALDDLPDLPKPDMLKMDTQGAELDILEGGAALLSDAVAIVPEVRFFRLYEGEPMLGAVDMRLREMGFMLHKVLPGASLRLTSSRIERLRPGRTRNQMIDADAIYVRDIARPERMSDAQLGHLALLADGVFRSIDLALRCLDLLVARGAFADAAIDAYVDALPASMKVPA